jgi:segregation and condensation protein B
MPIAFDRPIGILEANDRQRSRLMPKPSQSLDPDASDQMPLPQEEPEETRTSPEGEEPTPRGTGESQQDQEDQQSHQQEPECLLDPAEVLATVEAILFATDTSLSAAKIAQVGELPGRGIVKDAVEQLNQRYEQMGCAFRIDRIAGGYQMLTREEYHDVLSRLLKVKSDSRLSQAAMETLAVIAYRQPIIRADVEAIRGVACGDMIRKLMEKGLVKIVGRAEVLGRPMLYGTTRRFLEAFGLNSLEDLPRVEELRGPEQQESDKANPDSQDGDVCAQDDNAPDDASPEEPSDDSDSRAQAPTQQVDDAASAPDAAEQDEQAEGTEPQNQG